MKRQCQVLSGLLALFFLSFQESALGQFGAQHKRTLPARFAQNDQQFTGVEPRSDVAAQIVAAARAQVGKIHYDASYVRIPYPNGDVPGNRGLCADVVVRALRPLGCDLQQLIHEDRRRNFKIYPKVWGWGRLGPDPNTDHRSGPNQMFFFSRYGLSLTTEVSPHTLDEWQPGDFVYWNSGSPLRHAGVVSDVVNANGVPLVIHMGPRLCVLEDALLKWPIIGHFRYPAEEQVE